MDRLSAMRVFTEIVDRGSITEAAEGLNMSRAMVSRYLESLEGWLGVRLLHRTTRRISLTDAGTETLERCRQILELQFEVQRAAGARRTEPTGKLRITTSTSFAQMHMAAAVTDFMAAHPKTQVELIVLERTVNLVEERIDLAVRITNQLDSTMMARRLGTCRSVICAAPSYLASHGTPTTPDDLLHHNCITHATVGRTGYRLRSREKTVQVAVNGTFHSNEAIVTWQATLAGAGIAQLPLYLVHDDLAHGRLTALLSDWEPEHYGIHALYLSRRNQPHLLRLILDFLTKRFKSRATLWDTKTVGAQA